MQEYDERPAEPRMHDTGLVPLDSLERNELDPAPAARSYKKEPLFNKKVMIAWAIGAFVVWFGVTQIIPLAFHTARTTIKETMRELEDDGTITVTRSRDGRIMKIERRLPGASAPPAPVVAPVQAPTPVPAPEPVNAPEAKK